jgi:hypothetical protein
MIFTEINIRIYKTYKKSFKITKTITTIYPKKNNKNNEK